MPRKRSKSRKLARPRTPRRKPAQTLAGAILEGVGKLLAKAEIPKEFAPMVTAAAAHVAIATLPASKASAKERERCQKCGHTKSEHCTLATCAKGLCVASVQAMAGIPCRCEGWEPTGTWSGSNTAAILLQETVKHELCTGRKTWSTGEIVLKGLMG